MEIKKFTTLKNNIAAAYSKAANTYDAAAFVEQEIGSRLLERLRSINLQPSRILDLGCGTGYFMPQLSYLFPTANITGADIANGMVSFAKKNHQNPNFNFCIADAEKLPFPDRCFDLIFSNCCFTAKEDINALYAELHRCLNINGSLLFSTFGPDSLKEITVDGAWLDMHLLGDALMYAQYKDPVMDVERLVFTYDALQILLEDLHNSGSYEINDLLSIPNLNQECAVSYEVIYGIAIGNENVFKQNKDSNGNVLIDPNNIKILNY